MTASVSQGLQAALRHLSISIHLGSVCSVPGAVSLLTEPPPPREASSYLRGEEMEAQRGSLTCLM